jgi:hypothetical protein
MRNQMPRPLRTAATEEATDLFRIGGLETPNAATETVMQMLIKTSHQSA